jgi:UDP-glucose 4-epimerase
LKVIGVFGANGFIGKHLVRRLAGNGKTVRAISRRFDSEFVSELDHTVEFVISDFGDSIAMASALQGVDVVVQLISTSSPGLQNNYVIHDIEENVTPHVEFDVPPLSVAGRFRVRGYFTRFSLSCLA